MVCVPHLSACGGPRNDIKIFEVQQGAEVQSMLKDLLGDGIFNADGCIWREQRQTLQGVFQTRSLRTCMCDVFSDKALSMRDALSTVCGTGRSIDIQLLLER